MSNSTVTKVTKDDGWKLITTGSAGAFTATSSCLYYFGSNAPDSGTTGHRLNTGDLEPFVLNADESLYVKGDTHFITVSTGIGYATEWLRLKTLGLKAEPIQPYIELNCKLGTQWGLNTYDDDLEPTSATAGDGVRYLLLRTGSKPVALKGRVYGFDGLGIMVTTYRAPTYTNPVDVTNNVVYNLNDRNPETLLSKLFTVDFTNVSDEGTMWITPRAFLGDSKTGVNNHTTVEPDLSGLEIWFAENNEYLIKTESIDDADTQRYTLFATFYEGFPDVP